MIYTLHTLVDITETSQRHGGEFLARSQQRNFDSVLQTIGLCGNVYYKQGPQLIKTKIFKGSSTAWHFSWEMEIEDLFTVNGDPVAKLREIFNYVPVVVGLSEPVKLKAPMFVVGDNIVFDFE